MSNRRVLTLSRHNRAKAHQGVDRAPNGWVLELYSPEEEQSDKSRAHEFVWLTGAWSNLPESLADEYPSPEHLRKRALIQGGFYDEQIIDAGTAAAAFRVAAGLRSRPGEAFSLVIVRGPYVVIRTAKSQSRRAMKSAEFQRSKTAILEIVAEMIGVEPSQLSSTAKAAGVANNAPAEAVSA